MSWKRIKDKFDEWMLIWVVFSIMAAATIFQTFYILHLKSELKLFQKDEKTSTNSVSDSVSIQKRRR
jgi:phosphotransferase system  glucose/maltose/N-acetylglucosamine-specific IIC component